MILAVIVFLALAAPTPAPIPPCTPDTYDRNAWGTTPPVEPAAVATWTLASDAVAAPALQHDHHVSLHDAHRSGGCHWSPARKVAFGSDPANLNPVTASFNASKGHRSPDQLTGIAARIIDTAAEQCAYAQQHRAVKAAYGLTMGADEQTTVTAWIAGC